MLKKIFLLLHLFSVRNVGYKFSRYSGILGLKHEKLRIFTSFYGYQAKPTTANRLYQSNMQEGRITNKSHTCNLQQKYFEQISRGEKIFEARAATNRYKTFAVGDIIRFESSNNYVSARILKVTFFKTLDEMLNTVNISKLLPDISKEYSGVELINQASIVYNNLPGYEEKLLKFGVVVFELDLLANNEIANPTINNNDK